MEKYMAIKEGYESRGKEERGMLMGYERAGKCIDKRCVSDSVGKRQKVSTRITCILALHAVFIDHVTVFLQHDQISCQYLGFQ